jgi:poly-gamma-glutamate synthesis protein (capsule biosynthesis protein)
VVVAGGDIAFGGNVTAYISADKSYDPLAGLRLVLDGTNLRIASLVAPITDHPGAKAIWPAVPARAADALARAGIGALAVGSPELFASGASAFADTLTNLARVKIAAVGAATEPVKALVPAELSVDGWSIALFSVATWPEKDAAVKDGKDRVALPNPEIVAQAVRDARAHHDLVLVSHHGGQDLSDTPGAAQIALARAALEAGADAVFDHRSRIPSGVAWIQGRPAFYGLGNLLAEEDPKFPWTGRSYVVRLAVDASGQREVSVCPYLIVEGEPKLLSGTGRATQEGVFKRTIARLSDDYGGTVIGDPDENSCLRLAPTHAQVSDSSAPP